MDFSERFERHLLDRKMILPGEKIFVACSGGPDSVCLFFLLITLAKKWGWEIGLLHFNHGLRRRAAGQDEAFVKRLARRFRVPFYTGRSQVLKLARRDHESLEEAARKARYDFFSKAATDHEISKVALGHTQNDQAETVLMRVLQGTGLRGLSGIREVVRDGKLTFIRPLLNFTRQEILDYLHDQRIFYREDRSNRSLRFLRNRIRKKLLPHLQREFNPQVVAALARIPVIVAEENEALDQFAEKAWDKILKTRKRSRIDLRRKAFLALPSCLQFRIIDQALKRLDVRSGLNFDAWQKLKDNLYRKRFQYSLPRDLDLAIRHFTISLYRKPLQGRTR
ncbi:MAG: tRNA lysidine(34) synthetase TilS [Candidatus Omnitrophica bacterium]|nr:tRNA lysidine(34) synthetase TilS [Candidatus Omnitrophota bacterium]